MRPIRALPAAACAAVSLACGAAGAAHADNPVQLEGGDDSARDAIAALLPDRDAPATLFEAERIAEEAAERATAWMRAEGYYQGSAEAQADQAPPRARVLITLGPRFRFGPASIAYDDPPPIEQAQAGVTGAIKLAPMGRPARAADVLAAEAAAVAALERNGYADAEASGRVVTVDHADATMRADYRFRAGERVLLGELRADPSDLFRDAFLADVRNWSPGDVYSPENLARLRRDIAGTGAVSRISTRLEPREDSPGVRDVVLELEPAKRTAIEYGFGYSTTEGVGVEAEWTRRNYSRRADTLRLGATLGEMAQGVTAELARPHAAGLGRTVRYAAAIEREDPGAYVREGASIGAAIEAAQRLRMGVSYGASLSYDRFDDTAAVQNALVLAGFGEIRRNTTGNPLDARDGEILELRAEPSVSTGDATIGFVRTTAEYRTYESYGEQRNLTLAARMRGGWIGALAGSNEDLPPDRRFYAGGGGSVRGYEYNSIYPEARKLPGATPGGQGLVEISGEARYRSSDSIGFVAFIDGGNAFDSADDLSDFKWGAGVGARYDLGFAPLRIDLAVPLDPGPGDPDFALYVSLGQAF